MQKAAKQLEMKAPTIHVEGWDGKIEAYSYKPQWRQESDSE
jgi:hypothetical protein